MYFKSFSKLVCFCRNLTTAYVGEMTR